LAARHNHGEMFAWDRRGDNFRGEGGGEAPPPSRRRPKRWLRHCRRVVAAGRLRRARLSPGRTPPPAIKIQSTGARPAGRCAASWSLRYGGGSGR